MYGRFSLFVSSSTFSGSSIYESQPQPPLTNITSGSSEVCRYTSIVQYKLHNIQAPTFGVAIAWLEIDHEAQKRINRKIADSKRVPVCWSLLAMGLAIWLVFLDAPGNRNALHTFRRSVAVLSVLSSAATRNASSGTGILLQLS
ncbi:uncharacterized protein H6S33_003529 [Morchella sextelata]|uniref:uncharacterized protein n=1 Tax=Morchella sextelata TaxID=1174677 RepID=UPI001D04FAB9|nr:uncharacterized protein H6S33_003529 [Morchella sextelata]KAH0606695.1 hypothetical protein H6S33_003529 [Morchella sextelata]